MSLFTKANEILGMNARNLEYISRYNSRANKKFADNKIFTKEFLGSRGIGVAKLFHVVKSYSQLTPEFFKSLPDSFVMKPNRGFGGGGILVIKEREKKNFITVSGKKITPEELYRRCVEILDGKYSISGTNDNILFEERLETHPEFKRLTRVGLPDVRVIVFNKVPILAMARIPNEESEGKANMELGAYALGIDIGTGKTTGGAYYSKYIRHLPNGESAVGFQIPYWDEILLTVSQIQIVTGIGYLGVDLVITKTGVKVLELNARSGLKIQIANRIPQKIRLKKVADLKINTAEEAVEVAKTLFSQKLKVEEKFEARPIIGPRQDVILNQKNPIHLTARIALSEEENRIQSKFYDEESPLLDITIEGVRLKLPVKKGSITGADMVLAGKFLGDFYIDSNKEFDNAETLISAKVANEKIKNIDDKLAEIDKKIKLLAFINPQNLKEQRDLFFKNLNYSPRFLYKKATIDIPGLRRDLKRIPENVDHPLFPLFAAKVEELEKKLNLIEAVGSDEFSAHSEALFGRVTRTDYKHALDFLAQQRDNAADGSEIVSAKIAADRVRAFLDTNKLKHWKIKMMEDSVADMQVSKTGKVLINQSATFSENRLEALLVHEIGTHVFRNENGKRQPFRIFERGTAGYLETEEGLAVYNQNQLGLPLGEKTLSPALMIVAIYKSQNMRFGDLFHYLIHSMDATPDMAWSRCVKAKRGLSSDAVGAFTKDSLYFKGLRKIHKFLAKGGYIKDLYIGKITIEDLKVLQDIEGIVAAKYLL